jgi:CheY-like chemotaxis protein
MARRNAEPIALRGVHVLVVCDDEERRTLLAQALKHAAALVTTSASAEDAAEVMERVHANVIVAELRDADARARLINALHALPPDRGGKSPALALTRSHEDADEVLALGFQLHAAMPVRAAELCSAVAALAQQPAAWPRL